MIKHVMLLLSDKSVRFSTPLLNKITGIAVHTPKVTSCLGMPIYSIEPLDCIDHTGLVVCISGHYYALDHIFMAYLYSSDIHTHLHNSAAVSMGLPCYQMFSDDLNSGLLNENLKTSVFRALLLNTTVRDQLKQEFNLSCVK